MNRIKYSPLTRTIAIFALLGLWACETLIDDFEYEKKSSKLVVNAILCPDSILNIHVSTSINYNPPSTSKVIENAVVKLYKNDEEMGQLNSTGNGYYTLAGTYPQAGATYKVVVAAEGYGSVWAETTIPQKVENIEVEDKLQTTTHQDGYTTLRMEYQVKYEVPFNRNVFYGTSVSSQKQGTPPEYVCVERETPWFNGDYYEADSCYVVEGDSLAVRTEQLSIYSGSSLIKFYKDWGSYRISGFDEENYNEKIYFSNQNYNSNSLSLSIRVDYFDLLGNINNEITIWTDSYDKVLYNFMYSLAKIDQVEDDPFAEKVSVFTNVNGGLGIFASTNSSGFTIRYDEEFIDSITPKY
jgi:hypothetical protein